MSDLGFDTLDEYDENDSLLQILTELIQSAIKNILGMENDDDSETKIKL